MGAEQRWTVSNKATSLRALTMGAGFAWFAEENIRDELATGMLKPLAMKSGGERFAELYLALNTVKRHAYNIYAKLEVKKRTQAVSKARQLGLIP